MPEEKRIIENRNDIEAGVMFLQRGFLMQVLGIVDDEYVAVKFLLMARGGADPMIVKISALIGNEIISAEALKIWEVNNAKRKH